MNNRILSLLVLLAVFIPNPVQAKRLAPSTVEPLNYGDLHLVAPNDDGRRAYVQAWDIRTGKKLWEVTIFRNFVNPLMEEDVQHVYIRKMSVLDGKLILVTERDVVYSVDLKTHRVTKLKSKP